MKPLSIVWQRLVTPEGKTCDRCGGTQREIQRAVDELKAMLAPAGIEPVLEVRAIDEETFKARPAESNRIWIAGQPMEAWLGAEAGSSRCCSVCGEAQCRTIKVGPATFEVVPAALLVKAALRASAQLANATVPAAAAASR